MPHAANLREAAAAPLARDPALFPFIVFAIRTGAVASSPRCAKSITTVAACRSSAGGGALAFSIARDTGLCIIAGMATALDTLSGQALDARQCHLLGIYKQRYDRASRSRTLSTSCTRTWNGFSCGGAACSPPSLCHLGS
ncbi:hypothetical protein HU200_005004 [Digitaria exilis]|uniref:Uncharacterized protein n=1 Tax=Digitaria exilis TaxID=1010633 RepID=A0A835FRG7_9POAL|nr:hypothetical protein HU200_005004 [Digitaria exilis]